MTIVNPPEAVLGDRLDRFDQPLRRRRSVSDVPDSSSKTSGPLDADADSANCEHSSYSESSDCEGSALTAKVNGDANGFDCAKKFASRQDQIKEPDSSVKFAYTPAVPVHRKVKESPLSSDAIFKQSHAGLLNLCIVVLVAVNSRLIIENLMKYGLLIGSGFWFSSWSLRDWPLLMCCLTLPIFFLAAFVVEKLARNDLISRSVVGFLHLVITTSEIFYPAVVILRCKSAVLSGIMLMLFACIVWLKLVSYAHTNYDLRSLHKAADEVKETKMKMVDVAGSWFGHINSLIDWKTLHRLFI